MAGARNPWEENYGSNDGQDSGAKPWEQAYQQPEPPKARTLGAVANDTAIEVANAAAGGVSSAANFIKPGNAVSGWIDKNIVKAGEDSQSDVTKAAKKQFRDEVENADGVMGELGAVGKYVVQNPLLSAAQAAGSFVGPGLAVKATGFAGKAAQLGAKGVERAGRAGGVAAGAAMAGGDAAGTAYELSTKAGATEDQAVAAGRQASVIPAVIGGVGGMFGAEKLLAGAKGFAGGATSRALKTGASEAVQEGIEEGATQYEGQRAAMPYDPSIDPSKGVAAAAGMGAALGGITGAGASLLTGRDTGQQPNPGTQTPPGQTQPAPAAGPTLALPAPERGVIHVGPDGTARTPAYQAPGYVGDVTDVEPRAVNPVREQVAAAAEQGGALSSAALTAIDTGLSDAMQPAPEQAPPQISLEEADARDRAAYEQFFAGFDADPVVSRYFENDDDIPDFDAASNASEEDFLRALGATDEVIQDAIATSSQSAIPQSSAASNAGPQAYEPAGPREGSGEGAASQAGQVNAGAIQQAAPDAPVPGVGGPVGADGAGSAATAVSGASGPGGAGAGAATGSGAGATEVGSARAGGRGDSNQALSAPTNLRDALERVRQQKQEAANAQAAQAPAAAAAPVPGPAAAPAVEAAGPGLNIKAITAKQIPDMTDAELQAAIEHYGPAHKRTAKLQKEAQRRAAPSAITPTTTQGNADGPQASQAQQASPQPTQAAATPAAAAGLTDGAPTANTGAQAAPAPGPQAATAAEPEFTTIKTVYGDSVTVRTADLNSDKPRLRQYTKDGKSKAVPAIHRDNLDLTGDKRASIAKEDADNPFFNVITTKDGSTFASQAAASRELNHRAMGETHEVVAASEVQDGAQGFVIRRKRADAIGTSVNTAQGAINTEAPQATAPVGDEQQFAPETGTLGIPRAEMPQIPSQSHGGLVKHLNAQGIAHETTMVEAAELKPTQAEYSPAKVEAAKTAAGDRAVIVSSDGHIIDGHHQALAAAEEGKPVKAIVLDAPVEQALEAVKASPSAQPATLADAAPAQSPQDFVPAPDGGLDYGEITPEMGRAMRRQAGKIRLRRGDETQGLVHIAERHLDQFKKRGFESVPDFVASVAKSFTAIYKRDGAALDVVLEDGSRGRLVVQLEMAADGDFYDVKTASPIREDQFKNREPLWERAGTSTPTAGESSPPFPWGQNGDDSVPPNAPAAQPEAPKLTPAEAKSLMAWEDLGQKGGVKTHALTFYESQADKDAKRGRMIVAKVSKEVDSGNWTVEGTGEKLAVLGMAKKKAEQVGMEKAVADGFVEAAAAAPADATPEPAKPIEDAGEKIGGARKDRWKERGLNLDDLDAMTEAEGAELATKANVWKPDYEALAAQSEPVSAAMTKVIYDRLAAKPKKNTPEGRRQYVQMMRIVRDVLTEAKGPDAVRNAYLEIRKRAGLNAADPAAKSAGREMLFSVYKGRSDPFVLDGGDLMKVKKMVTDGFPAKGDPWKTRLTVGRAEGGAGTTERGIEIYMERSAEVGTPLTREQILDGFYRVSTKDNKTVAFAASKADAEAAAATVYERDMKGKKDGKPEPVRPNLDELKRENLPQRIDRDVTSEDFVRDLGFRGVEFGNWSAQDERQRILNMAYDGLMDLAEIMGVPPKAMSLNGTLGMAFGARGGGRFAAHYEPGKLVINMTKIRGGGSMAHEWAHAMDHYFGELDKPDAYTTQARGASGWYSEDQYNGVPRTRHERVGNEWKNVEKMRLDNLRPEMAAAFDEVMRALFQKQITKAEMVRSHELDLERTEALAAKEQDADMKAMYQNMATNKRQALDELRKDPDDKMYAGRGRTDYANQAQALSGKSVDGYWVRPTEMFARAFESWVFDRVTAMGARSDYLVHGVEEDRFAGGGYKGNPYPTGEERARINAAFDKLTKTIKTKETDTGNVAMFSRTGAQSANANKSTSRAWYDRFVSLLPESYRNDPHRREPLPAEDWNVQRATEVRGKVESLNKQLRGENDRKGYGPISIDGLGNLQVSALDVSVDDLDGPIKALANELGAGIAVTKVRAADIQALQRKGFVAEISLAPVADRIMGRPFVTPANAYATDAGAQGAIMTYKPRGFPAVLFARDAAIPPADSNARNAATQLLVDGLKAKWTRAPEIIVARNMQDAQIPQAVRDYDAQLKSQGSDGEARGFIYKGKVYLLSDQLKGPQQIAEVLFHEVLGHYGLRGAFGDSLNSILQQMGTMRRKDVVAKAREYGLFNKDALGGLDAATASDSQIWAAMSAKNRLSAAEEVLAEMAQTQPNIGFVQRAIAAIRTWLRSNVPGFKNFALTDDEIVRSYIIPARGFVNRSSETPQQALERAQVAFSRGGSADQTQTEAFKRWYGDWQNTSDVPKQMEPNRDGAQASRNGGAAPIDGIQRQAGVDQDAARADGARRFTFSGASGPTGADGAPVRLYHGTKDDIAAFDLAHPRRKDKGWLGNGVYLTSNLEDANQYARAKRGDAGPNLMPLYANVRNPYEATMAEKARLKGASPQEITAFTDGLKAKGHDGVVLWDDSGHMELVAFNAADVKSAIGNNGNFDPEDDRINFSRTTEAAKAVGDAIKSVTVTNIKQRAGFKLTDYLGIGLQALGRRQIVDIYGDMLPLGEYNRLVQQMEADKNEGSAEADQLVKRWAKLQDESKLADLMHDATLAQIDPAEDFVEGDDKARYMMLQGRFNALTDAAKQVYTDTRDSYKAHHAKVRSAIKERIERSEIKGERKAALLKQMDDEFFKAIKGVYFPLARFGQYAVTVKGPDGKVESVSRAETKAEAEALRNNLLSAFPRDKGFTVGRVMLSKDFIADRDAVGRGFMTELYQVLDQQNMDAAQRSELEDTLGQLYLSSLPDLSWAKHGIHRKGTPGFSQDARRAFAQNMFHGARYLAKLRYSDLMQDELAAMQKHVDDWREVEDFDQNSAQRVVTEMYHRHESLMNPKSNKLSTWATSLGFVFHLGLSPASAMVNLSQTALVAYPIMGAKWGFGKASAALLKASAEAAKGKNDITGSLNADELAAYNEAVRAGTIDVTMAHDLAGIAQGEDAGVMWKIRPVMRWASFLFHHAERFNRQVTFVAAYRLAREAGADHKAAFEQATKATYDGHFDYGAANRPRIMQGNVAKVLLLFKQYGQNMVYTLARNAQQAIKGESPEVRAQARKALGGLLATHAAAAGVLGLPMVTTLLAAASMIGGDDDEPWDAKVALQNMLADTFGQKPAEVLAHGLSRLTPWDISGRVGLDKLIFPDVQEGLEGQRLWESAATQALGPIGGIFGGVLKGLDLISDGHYKLGLEAMLPAVLRQGVKSIRYATEGAQDKGGVVIKDEVSLAGVAGQLLGFSPSEVRLAQEGKSAIYQHDKALTGRREELLSKAARATRLKDAEARAEAMKEIERFNQKNPKLRITPLNVLQSVRNSQKRIDQAEGGVYLPKNRRDAIQAGRFALAESE